MREPFCLCALLRDFFASSAWHGIREIAPIEGLRPNGFLARHGSHVVEPGELDNGSHSTCLSPPTELLICRHGGKPSYKKNEVHDFVRCSAEFSSRAIGIGKRSWNAVPLVVEFPASRKRQTLDASFLRAG